MSLHAWTWSAYSKTPYKKYLHSIGRPLRQIEYDQTCDYCANLTLEALTSRRGYFHAPGFTILTKNALTCRLCDLLLTSLEEGAPYRDVSRMNEDPSQIILLLDGIGTSYSKPYHAKLKVICKDHCECSGYYGELSSCSGSCHYLVSTYKTQNEISICDLNAQNPRLLIQRGFPIDPDPLSTSSIERAASWLRSCLEQHNGCGMAQTGLVEPINESHQPIHRLAPTERPLVYFPAPIRLIHVQDIGEGAMAKLVTMTTKTVEYVALSHRWNTGPMPGWVTKKENLQARSTEFAVAEFPKTILDAAVISHKLGFKYIWVDCYCIVQDDPNDWDIQSAQMADVYRHAQLTICADVALDDDSGFLRLREPMGEPCVPFRVKMHEKECMTLYARYYNYNNGTDLLCSPDMGSALYHNVIYSDLNKRGWTLQERVLSPRIIHFGANQMVWECRCCTEMEDGHEFPVREQWLLDIRNALFGDEISHFDIFKSWTHVVTEYTKRRLTVTQDVLPAISAVAKSIAERTGGTYLAGLWKETLHLDLLWWISDPEDPIHQHGERSESWRGPSWSWTWVPGVARFEVIEQTGLTQKHEERQEDFRSAIEFIDAKLDLSSDRSPFGRIEKGILTIKGPVMQVAYKSPLFRKGTELMRTSKAMQDAKEEKKDTDMDDPIFRRYLHQLQLVMGHAGSKAAYHDAHTREGSAGIYAVFEQKEVDGQNMLSASRDPIGVLFYDIPDEVEWNESPESVETWTVATALKTVDVDITRRDTKVFANCVVLLEVPWKRGTYGRRGVAYIWGDKQHDWFENAERKVLNLC